MDFHGILLKADDESRVATLVHKWDGPAYDGFHSTSPLEAAAWDWVAKGRQIDLPDVVVVESQIARGPDWVVRAVDGSTVTVTPGDWVIALRADTPEAWAQLKNWSAPAPPNHQMQKASTAMTLDQTNPALFDPAVDHALHDKFLKSVANGAAPPKGSPIYDQLHNGYLRHEARQSGKLSKAAPPFQSKTLPHDPDAMLPNGGLPYSGNPAVGHGNDISTQASQWGIILATLNAARRATNADNLDGTMLAKSGESTNDNALAQARYAATLRYQIDPVFRATIDNPSPQHLATVAKVEAGLTKLAKSRDVTLDDVRTILEDLQGAR
jgi:hypothetical protein